MKLPQLLLSLLVLFLTCTVAQQQQHSPLRNDTHFTCVPFGTCEPCPEDALNEPFCQPFGNRRLVHCVPVSATPSHTNSSHPGSADTHQGETPAWESCGRIVEKERGDFYEFFACNLVIALIAIGVVFVRSKRLKAMQARQLAARIGLARAVPGGWTEG